MAGGMSITTWCFGREKEFNVRMEPLEYCIDILMLQTNK